MLTKINASGIQRTLKHSSISATRLSRFPHQLFLNFNRTSKHLTFTFTDSNLSLKLWSWNISWNFAMKAANARKTEEYHQDIIFCANKWFWSPQWLDWNTYHRLFSSSALPAYLLFALIVILALLRSTLERWRAPTPPATVGSSSSGCLTKLFSRSRMEFHLK